jgi:pimeloyl-ACP methyl ester carboxylesterase
MASLEEVILVHGLWYRAWSMRVLHRRLESAGFAVRRFSYPTRTVAPKVNAAALGEFCVASGASALHLVGHSLGGLLALQALGLAGQLPPGRLVLLGTPLAGSRVARRSASLPGGGFLLGQAARLLEAGAAHLPANRETGMIAGVRPLGLGRLVGGLREPHDGTVCVDETRSVELAGRIELPVTHTGMLVSPRVAAQTAHFLRKGHFSD